MGQDLSTRQGQGQLESFSKYSALYTQMQVVLYIHQSKEGLRLEEPV